MKEGNFKERFSAEQREQEADRIINKYSGRIPVICEVAKTSTEFNLDKSKFLVPSDLSVGQFVYVIRKRLKLGPEKAIFMFVDNVLPPTAMLMSQLYNEHKDQDRFLYCVISSENTFGASRDFMRVYFM